MDPEKKFDKEKVKELWDKSKTAVGKVSKTVWIILAVAVMTIAAGIVIYWNTRPYSILVTGASASEINTVTNWLEGQGVQDYRYQGSDTILVPERRAVALKAALLTEMYSTGGYDYDIYFDNVSMLSTESERTNAWKIAVEQKMEAVISQMKGVLSASVQITPGEDRIYVLDSGNVVDATATIMVTTRDGKVLDSGVAQAIRGYVAGAVQGLKLSLVDLYDTNGNHYNGTTSDSTADSSATALKFQTEQEQANLIRSEVMWLLSAMFGQDNVRVAANTTVEVSNSIIDENDVWIPDYIDDEYRGKGEGIKSDKLWEYTYNASDDVIAGGLVGTEANADIPTDVEREPGLNDTAGKLDGAGQTEYSNPSRTTHTVRRAAYITDRHVSVSINSAAIPEGGLDTENLRALIANAAGITAVATETQTAAEILASKVTIYVGPFYQPASENPPEIISWWWPFGDIVEPWVALAALAGLLLFFIVLLIVVIAVSRGRRRKRALAEAEAEASQLSEAELQQQMAQEMLAAMGVPQLESVGADVMSLQSEKSMELRQDIRQFAEENPEVAAQLLRSWLRGGEDNG